MSDTAALFLRQSRALLAADYLPKIERCVAMLPDEDVWWRPNEASNSIGNLLLHLRGNVTQWILGGVGGREFVRDRQREFDERAQRPSGELLAAVRAVVSDADAVLASQTDGTLRERRLIQGYEVTVLEAIYHVVEHFGMHTGQIILIAKMRRGMDLQLWRPPLTPGA